MTTPSTDSTQQSGRRGVPPNFDAAQKFAQRNSGSLRRGMLGFTLSHEQFPVTELLELGPVAEQAGFDVLTTSDHFQPWQDNEGHSCSTWVTLGALSQRVRRCWMGTTITCPTLRYQPAIVAQVFASLSLLSPGRIFLGVGSGEALNEQAATGQWPDWKERSERLIEATQIIRELWRGELLTHSGKYYEVDGKLYDPPAQPMPILMAANGEQAMRRAGEHGDGLITDPETWQQHRDIFKDAARRAGKDPEQMPVLLESFVVVGDKDEARHGADLWRFLPQAFQGYHNIDDPREIQRRAFAEVDIEQVYKQWTISADPQVHIDKLTELYQSGATLITVHSGQTDQRKVIEFYGDQVIPRLRQEFELDDESVARPSIN